MATLWRDVRYAIRTLSANRLFTLMVVLPLGLAIGATTAVFSFTDAVLLRPLPYHEGNRLVLLWASKSREISPLASWRQSGRLQIEAASAHLHRQVANTWLCNNVGGPGYSDSAECK